MIDGKRDRLSGLRAGETAEVSELCLEAGMKRRLQDLGMVPGARITCLLKSPFGDPVAYDIMGAVIALRKEDTDGIWMYRQIQENTAGQEILVAASYDETV